MRTLHYGGAPGWGKYDAEPARCGQQLGEDHDTTHAPLRLVIPCATWAVCARCLEMTRPEIEWLQLVASNPDVAELVAYNGGKLP